MMGSDVTSTAKTASRIRPEPLSAHSPGSSKDQHCPDHQVENVVDRRPEKEIAGEETGGACGGLVEIDESKYDIEESRAPLAPGRGRDQPQQTEHDMEEIVGGGDARHPPFRRRDEAGDADKDQKRSEELKDANVEAGRAVGHDGGDRLKEDLGGVRKGVGSIPTYGAEVASDGESETGPAE